jgi:hypothetical protein
MRMQAGTPIIRNGFEKQSARQVRRHLARRFERLGRKGRQQRLAIRRAAMRPVSRSKPAAGFISMLACSCSNCRQSIACASVGMRSPANAGPYQPPASSRISSARSCALTSPVPSVVRASVSSWMSTGTPSRLSMTSNSTMRKPAAAPARIAASVFSGAADPPPRCAIHRG